MTLHHRRLMARRPIAIPNPALAGWGHMTPRYFHLSGGCTSLLTSGNGALLFMDNLWFRDINNHRFRLDDDASGYAAACEDQGDDQKSRKEVYSRFHNRRVLWQIDIRVTLVTLPSLQRYGRLVSAYRPKSHLYAIVISHAFLSLK